MAGRNSKVKLNKLVMHIVRNRPWLEVEYLTEAEARLTTTDEGSEVKLELNLLDIRERIGGTTLNTIKVRAEASYKAVKASIEVLLGVPEDIMHESIAEDIGHRIDGLVGKVRDVVLNPFMGERTLAEEASKGGEE